MGSPERPYLQCGCGERCRTETGLAAGGGYLYREPGEPGLAVSEQLPGFRYGRPGRAVELQEPPVEAVPGHEGPASQGETHRRAYRYTQRQWFDGSLGRVPHPGYGKAAAVGMWIDYGLVNEFLREWCLRKEQLKSGEISEDEYFEWKINWPASSSSVDEKGNDNCNNSYQWKSN